MLSASSKAKYMANYILHQGLQSGDSESSGSCTINDTNKIQRKQCRIEWNHSLASPFLPKEYWWLLPEFWTCRTWKQMNQELDSGLFYSSYPHSSYGQFYVMAKNQTKLQQKLVWIIWKCYFYRLKWWHISNNFAGLYHMLVGFTFFIVWTELEV